MSKGTETGKLEAWAGGRENRGKSLVRYRTVWDNAGEKSEDILLKIQTSRESLRLS